MRDLVLVQSCFWRSLVFGAALFDRYSGSSQDMVDRGFVDGCRTFCDFL
jgi:hypothetical protein